jgi:hypothetical protein
MNTNDAAGTPGVPLEGASPSSGLPDAARRALAEAEARRAAEPARPAPPEEGGRGGLDPVRYADWEIAGRAVDF